MTRSNAGVHNPNVIDVMSYDTRADQYCLTMIETRPWDGSTQRLLELQEKGNGYLSFLLDGRLKEVYPESVGKPVRIELHCPESPDPRTSEILGRMSEELRKHGVGFQLVVITDNR